MIVYLSNILNNRATIKAVDAAVNSRQWEKAFKIMEVVTDKTAMAKYNVRMAQHFASNGDFEVNFQK